MNTISNVKDDRYLKAVGWFVAALLIGCVNDAIVQYLSSEARAALLYFSHGVATMPLGPIMWRSRLGLSDLLANS